MFDIVSFIPRAIMQGIPLLYGCTGETISEKSGSLNLGIPGVMYVGGICGVIGAFLYEQSCGGQVNSFLAVLIPLLACLIGSLLMGLLFSLLTITLRVNQNVVGLAMTTFGVGVGNFFGGSLIKLTGSDVPSIALSATSNCFSKGLPFGGSGAFSKMFLSYGFLAYTAIVIAFVAPFVAFVNSIPSCIMGGVCMALYGFIAVSGLKMVQAVDLNKNKNLFVVSVILISGIGGLTLNFGEVTITSIACALILGILTNLMLKNGQEE